ncbi:hypothetical protein [Erwinia phage Virsaitis27]|nr:hypothetical protein [Erwinia phage Virsaitis27]
MTQEQFETWQSLHKANTLAIRKYAEAIGAEKCDYEIKSASCTWGITEAQLCDFVRTLINE